MTKESKKKMGVKRKIKIKGLEKVYEYFEKDPEKALPLIMDWVNKFSTGAGESQKAIMNEMLSNPDNPWYKLLVSLWDDIDRDTVKKLFTNFVINAGLIGLEKQNKTRDEHNCNVPWAILMDPTSACNLRCTGCWAAEYGDKLNMDFDTLDGIIEQGKEMGTYMYIYSGGEPLVRKKDILKLCEKHDDCAFLAFTNGTLIDDEFTDGMLRVKNFVPAISVEGFEEATDSRRGAGTFAAVEAAMDLLKSKKLPFGVSCCYTHANTNAIGDEEFVDWIIGKGGKFAWFFTYMPIGADAVPELIATAEDRKFMYRQLRKFRKEKSLFTMDFWNDGEFVNGCIAGGRYYLHINANGDIEPCAFVHYSDSNIKDKTLLEAYKSPLFMNYKKNQPFNKNLMQPCPVLDNPDKILDVVNDSEAVSTDLESPEAIEDYAGRCREAAKNWEPVAKDIWENEYHKKRISR